MPERDISPGTEVGLSATVLAVEGFICLLKIDRGPEMVPVLVHRSALCRPVDRLQWTQTIPTVKGLYLEDVPGEPVKVVARVSLSEMPFSRDPGASWYGPIPANNFSAEEKAEAAHARRAGVE